MPAEKRQELERRPNEVPVFQEYPQENKVRILDVVLDRLPLPDDVNSRRFIPKWDLLKSSTCWDTPTATLIRDMAYRLNAGVSSRNEGPTGVSKSFAAEVICAITNRSYLRHNYSKESDPGDTIGRFVPADARLAVRFQELLSEPGLDSDLKDLIKTAEKQSRPLTILESKKIAASLGIDSIDDQIQWRWQNGTLTGSMAYGSVFGADEPNMAPGNVIERENSAVEKRPQLRLVEHEGEIVRPLTPDEQSIVDAGGIIPGVIGLDSKFWYVAAQNPYGIGGGRFEESEARRNRLQDRVVEALTTKEYEEFLTFMIKGDQPDIVWQNRRYKGDRNVQTPYRDLESIPNVDAVIKWLATFQTDLKGLVDKGKIGSEKDIKGGSYIYARRNLERFLDSVKRGSTALLDVDKLFKTGEIEFNSNWHDLFIEAVHQEYLAGMYREDQEIVQDLIKASGVEEVLGESKNNPKAPKWIEKASKKGVHIEQGQDTWQIS